MITAYCQKLGDNMTKPNGAIIYRGPSLIDGAPIVAIVTGLSRPSDNDKTGNMLQTWILRADVGPIAAVNSGADKSICGGCVHRGSKSRKRSCYVQVGQAPRQIFEAFERGNYPEIDAAGLGVGRSVRLGAYGDPAAVPVAVWQALIVGAVSHTGYTHQWKSARLGTADLMAICQASVDNAKDLEKAKARGLGTFRVLRKLEVLQSNEIHCPADKRPGEVTCAACGLCDGRGVNIAIPSHGAGAANYDKA